MVTGNGIYHQQFSEQVIFFFLVAIDLQIKTRNWRCQSLSRKTHITLFLGVEILVKDNRLFTPGKKKTKISKHVIFN